MALKRTEQSKHGLIDEENNNFTLRKCSDNNKKTFPDDNI
jgi:hypothetical protein